MKKILWKLDKVRVAGRGQPRLDVTCLDIPAGVIAILGPSGAGKTTLLNLLAGFERPAAGTVVSHLAVSPGELPLFWGPPGDGLWPSETVVAHLRRVTPSGTPPGEAERLLELFGLKDKSDVRPDLLSQGECSRLSLARALASQARVLVLDEPLVHVEPARLLPYWDVLHAERPAGGSLVFSTHEPELVLRSAQHVIGLAEGNVVFSGSAEQLERDPPSEALAWYLGAANWIPARESAFWLARSSTHDRCVRPHDLQADAVSDGPVVIDAVRRSRGLNELDARHEPTGERRRFYISRLAQELQAGVRVRFSVLGLLLALCFALSGCGGATAGSDQTLTEVGYWMLPSEGIRIPAPRAVHAAGDDLYILDNVGRVLVYDGEGELKKQWWMPEYSVGRPEKICLLPDGRLAVADTHYHRVILFDQEGTEVGRLGGFGKDAGQFIFPVATACDDAGNLYVCEYGGNDRIQKFSPDDRFLLSIGGYGTEPGQFQRPSGMVCRGDRLYVVDAFNNRIQVFSTDGAFVEILGADLGAASPELNYPYDIALSPADELFVVEYGAGRVSRLDLKGRLLGRFGANGSGDGQFKTPWGLAVDKHARVFVADTGNRRLVQLKL